jgi:hypothetical protein
VGSATKVGDDTTAFYMEQRWIPVLAYSPNFIGRPRHLPRPVRGRLHVGPGGQPDPAQPGRRLNADQVNIQTKNVNVSLYPTRNPYKLSVVLGTQSVYDTHLRPDHTRSSDIVKTGYKLTFLGTDATGVSVYGRFGGHRWKLSFLPVGAAQPDKATKDDARLSFVWIVHARLQQSHPAGHGGGPVATGTSRTTPKEKPTPTRAW